jgi:hypothetical protein
VRLFAAIWIALVSLAQLDDAKRAEELHDKGYKLFVAGQAAEGIPFVEESLAIHRRLRKKPEETINLRMLATLHDGIGERQKSLEFFRRALALTRGSGDRALEAKTLRDLGVLHYNLNDNAMAFRYFEQSLALQRRDAKPSVLALTLFSTGELRRYLGENDAARRLFEEALPLARASGERSCEADVLGSLAMLDLKARRHESAQEQLEKALAIRIETKDMRGEASTRGKLGFLFEARGDFAAARSQLSLATEGYAKNRYKGGEAFIRQALAHLEAKQGNDETAAEQMLAAVTLAEGLRQRLSDRDLRATYIGYVQNRYEFLIETYLRIDKGNPRRAFEMSERARARALVEALADSGLDSGEDRKPTLSLDEIQKRILDEDTALLEFALSEKRSHAFVVTRNGIRHFEVPGRAEIERAARAAYERYRIAGPLPDEAPLRKWLPPARARRLIVVADGALQYLPFASLYPGSRVVLAPSASALAGLRERETAPAKRRVVTLADPVAPRMARLAFSRDEAKWIAASLPAEESLTLLGEAATKEAALTSRGAILHLAAHSILNTERPERTEIVLSGGSLRLRDIVRSKIAARMVVLSACQTALGKEMRREGMLGLTRAFELAGAKSVVSSLWKVDDRATAELMKRFYAAMFQENLAPDAALQAAQGKLRGTSRWAHPFYWAGFVLEGDWR